MGQPDLTNSHRTESAGIRQQPGREDRRCGIHAPAQSIHGIGRRGCGSRGSHHVVANCGGLTASFARDAAAMRSAGLAAVPECVEVVHCRAAAEHAVAACSGPAAAEHVVAVCPGSAPAAVERAVVAEHVAVRAWIVRACSVAVGDDLAFRPAAPVVRRQGRFREAKTEWLYWRFQSLSYGLPLLLLVTYTCSSASFLSLH